MPRLALAGEALGPQHVQIELLDAEQNPVAAPVDVPLPEPLLMEIPSGRAGFEWIETDQPLSLALEGVPEAAMFRASSGGLVLAEMALENAIAGMPGPPAARRTFNAAGGWKLLLVSEQFADAQSFFAACAQLNQHIVGNAPFSDQNVASRFQIEALFWPSGASGLFNTRTQGRLVFGDHDLVRRFVQASGSTGRMTMVLVNSAVRGGAGGTRERPAWVTITSEVGEDWEAVALHELGHSFGLADEYDDAAQPTPEPNPLEPNVTKQKNAANAPWAALRTPGLSHNPTHNSLGQPAVNPGIIGTFEGARYKRTRRYRPTAECLMRTTDKSFCPVCQAQIRRILAAA